MQSRAIGEALYTFYLGVPYVCDTHHTGSNRRAIHMHRTGTTKANTAAIFSTNQTKTVPKNPK
jgi:hypothetical protein